MLINLCDEKGFSMCIIQETDYMKWTRQLRDNNNGRCPAAVAEPSNYAILSISLLKYVNTKGDNTNTTEQHYAINIT